MKRLRLELEAAGLGNYTPLQATTVGLAAASLVSSWVQISFEVFGLTLFSFIAVIGMMLESLRIRAGQRSELIKRAWPEVIDSLQSASSSGFGIVDSLDEVARSGPIQIRAMFKGLVERIDSGLGMDKALDWFKVQFGQIQADRLVELIRVVHKSGGIGYIESLRDQAARTRSEIALWGELDSKQGWVTGTAKMAIVAPWIIVATLSARSENVEIYNTSEGTGVLLFGLMVSLMAYRLVALMGNLSRPKRVLTK